MTPEHENLQGPEARVDRSLQALFPPPPELEQDFEEQVMHRVGAERRSWLERHRVFLAMSLYWLVSISFCGWLLGEGAPVDAAAPWAVGAVVIFMLLAGVLAAWWVARQGRLGLSELWLRTVQP